VRGFGELNVQITDPRQFAARVAGVQGASQADEIRDRVREIVV
jgi:membrane protease subunit (stomatin/prohibitin family)